MKLILARRTWLTVLLAALIVIGVGRIANAQSGGASQAGATFRDCPDRPEMLVIPAGHFLMGASPGEWDRDIEDARFPYGWFIRRMKAHALPQHLVKIGQTFALAQYDVTRSEFARFVRETGYSTAGTKFLVFGNCIVQKAGYKPSHPPGASWHNSGYAQTDRDPVVCVSRNDAKAYIAWLNAKLDASQLAGRDGPYRLPSEAEWEYAARGGRRSERWWGNSLGQNHANCSVCSSAWDRKGTSPVGSFDANPFGLYDMLGNVDQLVEDCWNGSYAGAPSDGTAWESKTCGDHVTRGSDWQSDARQIRSDYRSYLGTDDRDNTIDFRVAKTIR